MKTTIDDIEIFIVTYNRVFYLEQSLKSILAQTAVVKQVTVLDNNSTDNTEEMVKKYASRGVKYVKTFGFLGNFKKAKEIVSKKYCMLFHDDDILHPKYLEYALKALNKYENIALVTTRYTEFKNNDLPTIPDMVSERHYLFETQKEFAKHMLIIQGISYSPFIYRTEYFKKTPLEYEKYSKFNDWPFMIKIAKCGNVVLFDDKNLFYVRCHKNQDTNTFDNTPTLEQIVNWNKPFYDAIIGSDEPSIGDKIMFMHMSISHAYNKYNNFMSQADKEKYSLESIKKCISSKGMMIPLDDIPKEEIKSICTTYLTNIISSNIKENL